MIAALAIALYGTLAALLSVSAVRVMRWSGLSPIHQNGSHDA